MGPTSLAKSPSPKLQSPPPSPSRRPQSPDNPSPCGPIREVCISRFTLGVFFGEINKTFYLIEKPEKYTSILKALLVPVNSTNVYGGSEGIAPLLLNLSAWTNVNGQLHARGELSYLAPLGSENISAPYFKQCFFRGGGYYPPPD